MRQVPSASAIWPYCATAPKGLIFQQAGGIYYRRHHLRSYLVFLIAPLQAGITKTLTAAGVPEAVVTQVTACAKTAAPLIVRRATGDPVSLVSSTFGLWTGATSPDKILIDAAPGCAEPVAAALADFTKGV